MKRLKLEDFRIKNLMDESEERTEDDKKNQLLGQVLGDCHDDDSGGWESGGITHQDTWAE